MTKRIDETIKPMFIEEVQEVQEVQKGPKRVWDADKRQVWQIKGTQGLKQVWLVDGEVKVNSNHGWEDPTDGFEVAENVSPTMPYQTYDTSWKQDVNTGGGEPEE